MRIKSEPTTSDAAQRSASMKALIPVAHTPSTAQVHHVAQPRIGLELHQTHAFISYSMEHQHETNPAGSEHPILLLHRNRSKGGLPYRYALRPCMSNVPQAGDAASLEVIFRNTVC